MLVCEFFLQEVDDGLGGGCPGEMLAAYGDRSVPMISEELLDGFPDGVRIIGVEVDGSIATNLAQYGDVRDQHRASATYGFNGRQTESFVERWENETDGLIV